MQYTISAAWVVDCEPDALEAATESPLHTDIVQHLITTAQLMRAKYPETPFRLVLSDMIVSAPERVYAEIERGGD